MTRQQVSGETDAIAIDVNDILDDHPSLNGRITRIICDATVVADSASDQLTITITYNCSNCAGNRIRTRVVTGSLPQGVHWNDLGSMLNVSINILHISRLRVTEL